MITRNWSIGSALLPWFASLCLSTTIVAQDKEQLDATISKIVTAAGGEAKVPKLFKISERLKVGTDPNKPASERTSILEPPKYWWIGKRERVSEEKEPATFLVWAWTLGMLLDDESKIELIKDVDAEVPPTIGLRVSGTVDPAMELYFDSSTYLLSRIEWRADIHRFSEWREIDGWRYPSKCVGTKKTTGKDWYVTEILNFETLDSLPTNLSRTP